MDFSEEWKSLWTVLSVFSPPLLIDHNDTETGASLSSSRPKVKTKHKIGPLIFNPLPDTIFLLFSSTFLSPQLPPPYPSFSLTRFLQTSIPGSSLIPSVCNSIATHFTPHISSSEDNEADYRSSLFLSHNCLQLLSCPGTRSTLAFFATGDNSDQVGFLILSVEETLLVARGASGNSDGKGRVFLTRNKWKHRISRLLVNPCCAFGSSSFSNSGNSYFSNIGYLLASTRYSVHWYIIKIREIDFPSEKSARVDCIGSKLFKSCAVVHACWNPHLPEESMVLLENGELFLFDLDDCSHTKIQGFVMKFSGKKVKVVWHDQNISGGGQWLSCEFSWHPRILIVAHSNALFLVDLRSEKCNMNCLLKTDVLAMGNPIKNIRSDKFIAFARASSDGFYYTVASSGLLLLCDVRRPLVPVLKWAHCLDNPRCITVFRLSELRSNPKDDVYRWASDSGYCILLGSFHSCEFNSFCYGPDNRGGVANEISKFCQSVYAWGLPFKFSLSGRDCNHASCSVKEEFAKDTLPEWIDWRQKKEIVLGFGILGKDLSIHLSEPDSYGGFSLIRLMSSGKLELQRYCASWDTVKNFSDAHREPPLQFENSLLYAFGECEYDFIKKFQYLKLDYLNGYLENNLDKILIEKMEKRRGGSQGKMTFGSNFHWPCQMLREYSLSTLRSSSSFHDVFEDVSLPTSIYEIALRSIWASLPADLLRLAFSTFSEFFEVLVNQQKVSMEFLGILNQPHLPPFYFRDPSFRSSKWSNKVQSRSTLVGPVLPIHFLVTLGKLRIGEVDGQSAEMEIESRCKKAMKAAEEILALYSSSNLYSDHAVSLADDKEEMFHGCQKVKLFSLHETSAFNDETSVEDSALEKFDCKDKKFTTLILKSFKKILPSAEMEVGGLELFDILYPSELKFHARSLQFGPKELSTYKLLTRQHLKFQDSFNLYQDYITRSNIPKKDIL